MKANIKMSEVWPGNERKMSHSLDRKWLIKTNVEVTSNWKIGGEPVTLLNFFKWALAFLRRGWTSLGGEHALRWAQETLHSPTALSPSAKWGFVISGALLLGGLEGKMRQHKWRLTWVWSFTDVRQMGWKARRAAAWGPHPAPVSSVGTAGPTVLGGSWCQATGGSISIWAVLADFLERSKKGCEFPRRVWFLLSFNA